MKVFALNYHPDRDTGFIIGLYEDEKELHEDIKTLQSIDKLASSLNNKDLHPQQNGDFSHYSWREMDITPRKWINEASEKLKQESLLIEGGKSMKLTEFETHAGSAAILAFSNALETLLRRWLIDNHMGFNREM